MRAMRVAEDHALTARAKSSWVFVAVDLTADDKVFAVLVDAVRMRSLGKISHAVFGVGGQYRRSMTPGAPRTPAAGD